MLLQDKIRTDSVPYVLNMVHRIDRPSYTISEMQADVSAGAYSSGFHFQALLLFESINCCNLGGLQELWSSFSYPLQRGFREF
jgi:hypothetical protein